MKNRYFRRFPKIVAPTWKFQNRQHLRPNRRRQRAATETVWAEIHFLSLRHPARGPYAGAYPTRAARRRLGNAARITFRAAPFLLEALRFPGTFSGSVRNETQRQYS